MNTEHFAEMLAEEKKKLEAELSSIGKRSSFVPNDWEAVPQETGAEPDSIDQASDATLNEENSIILADLEARYDTILSALKRIADGTYGTCEVCGETIEEERLGADPAATTCIAHK